MHPRTKKQIEAHSIPIPSEWTCLPPVGYMEMLLLVESAAMVMTDSGGLQKEAFFLDTPCITLRDTTEWTETVACGANHLVMDSTTSVNHEALHAAIQSAQHYTGGDHHPYGNGTAAQQIVEIITKTR